MIDNTTRTEKQEIFVDDDDGCGRDREHDGMAHGTRMNERRSAISSGSPDVVGDESSRYFWKRRHFPARSLAGRVDSVDTCWTRNRRDAYPPPSRRPPNNNNYYHITIIFTLILYGIVMIMILRFQFAKWDHNSRHRAIVGSHPVPSTRWPVTKSVGARRPAVGIMSSDRNMSYYVQTSFSFCHAATDLDEITVAITRNRSLPPHPRQ